MLSETFFAASIMYLALKPQRKTAKSSGVSTEIVLGEGKLKPPLICWPKFSHKRSIMPLIRGILLFCEIIKEHKASHGSCLKMRIPLECSAAVFKVSVLINLIISL